MSNISHRSRVVYEIILEYFEGNKKEALRLWVELYPSSNPVKCLGENEELSSQTLNGYECYNNMNKLGLKKGETFV